MEHRGRLRATAIVAVLAALSVMAAGSAGAGHNNCDEGTAPNHVWTGVVGWDIQPVFYGVCVGDFEVRVHYAPGNTYAGTTVCDNNNGGCGSYAYAGLASAEPIGTCVVFYTYEGGSEPQRHTAGLDCPPPPG